MNPNPIVVYTDGSMSLHTNVGACAVIIQYDGKIKQKGYLIEQCPSVLYAELMAIYEFSAWCTRHHIVDHRIVEIRLDREDIYWLLTGGKRPRLIPEAKLLVSRIKRNFNLCGGMRLSFQWIPRTDNTEADAIARQVREEYEGSIQRHEVS